MAAVDHCLACGAPIDQPRRGRTRLFCGDTCRQRHHRARSRAVFALLTGGSTPPTKVSDLADPDLAVVATVTEAWTVAAKLARGAEAARPELAWRCRKAAEALDAALSRYFAPPVGPGDAPPP